MQEIVTATNAYAAIRLRVENDLLNFIQIVFAYVTCIWTTRIKS